jgi:hypothetical protein
MNTTMDLALIEFIRKYQPELFPDGELKGYFAPAMGEDKKYLDSIDFHHIWTLVTADDDGDFILNGYHLFNRLSYFVTKIPWKDGEDITIFYRPYEE